MKAFRIIGRSIRDSIKSVFRNLSLSMASILCTTITLILVAVSLFLSYNVREVTNTLEKELTIVVYFKSDVTKEQMTEFDNDMKTLSNVESATLKTKEEWKAEMGKDSETLKTTLEYLEENPLLNSEIIRVNDVKNLGSTANTIKNKYNDIVSSAQYGEGMVENVIGIFDAISVGTLGIVVALVLVTAFLINNTIKLTIYSRRTEIEIMRLVGSSNIAIKLPFIFEGFFLGILGSIVPVIISIYGYVFLYQKTGGYVFTKIITLVEPFPLALFISLILVGIGALVGMFASGRAVRKYLKI